MTIDTPSSGQISQLWNLWRETFGDSGAFLEAFFDTAYSPERCLCVSENSTVAAAVYWFNCTCRGQKLAYIYALATSVKYRGRGVAHRLMDTVHHTLEQQGYEGVILVPVTQTLRGFYEGMGYRTCSRISEFVCGGAADEVQLRRVTPQEYALQRRELLSLLVPDAVIQENENLAFLATQAELYTGQNFLLAAHGDGDTLVGIELLGDAQMAPGIVQALGYTKGNFRTPGDGEDFAMYRPLGGSQLPAPSYFGFAFD